jgi:predicted DNA-binding protein
MVDRRPRIEQEAFVTDPAPRPQLLPWSGLPATRWVVLKRDREPGEGVGQPGTPPVRIARGCCMRMMYDSYIVKRTQIYLDRTQADELARRSAAHGTTSSHLIRQAIEAYLAGPDDDAAELALQRSAVRDSFGSVSRLPDGATYVERLRDGDRARDQELAERWRSRSR